MCGITGIVGSDPRHEISRERLQSMMEVIRHRGPDEEGVYLSPRTGGLLAGLGHRRLSIIDLAAGHQPLANEDETVWICFNGEIYNHAELRTELEARGHSYRTRCDTESIVHAWEEYGPECVHKLRGMFAFAIWDDNRKVLFAARDRLGIKPFYYAHLDDGLVFGSEIKSLLASELLPARVNHASLPEFLTFGQTGDESTLFEGIQKLMPGHWLRLDANGLETRRYWDWSFDEEGPFQEDSWYVQRFIEELEESVGLRLMADVPLGMFLSGGLDSSLIAATMSRRVTDRIQTFSVGFESQYYSELGHARTVAEHIGSEHREVILRPDDFFEALPRLVWHEDEPLKDAPSVALYFVSKLAAEHVKVVLTGEGSDELFAGYNDRYWVASLNRHLLRMGGGLFPDALRKHVVRKYLWSLPLPLRAKKALSHTFLYLDPRPSGFLFDNFYSIFSSEMQRELLSPELRDRVANRDPYANAVGLLEKGDSRKFLHRMLYADVNMYLVELLMKQDQMSMAASIESRVPFLDHRFVEFAGTVPAGLRLRGRKGKWVVKQAAEQLLPSSIVHRPKMGFPVPFRSWIQEDRGDFVREILLDNRTRQRGYFDMSYVEKLLEDHTSGRRDCHSQVWLILNFELWNRIFIDQKKVSAVVC